MLSSFINERYFITLASIIYALTFLFAILMLLKSYRYSQRTLLLIIGVGFCLHTIGLCLQGVKEGSFPLGNIFEIIQFINWSAILLYLTTGKAFRESLLGFLTTGLVSILSLLSILFSSWNTENNISSSAIHPWIETHAAIAIFSYGVFGILALTSIMYLLQTYGLKKKRLEMLFYYLPSILQIDQMNRRLLIIGTAGLTLSMGFIILYSIYATANVSLFKLIFTIILWFTYLVTLILHLTKHLLTKQFSWTCIILFFLSLFSLWPVEIDRRDKNTVSLMGKIGIAEQVTKIVP